MLKRISPTPRFSLTGLAGLADIDIWNPKFLSAIALFGLLLAVSDSNRFLQQTGRSLALFAGGAAVAGLLQTNENRPALYQLRRELQTAHEQQVTDLFATEAQQQQLLSELYESAIAEVSLLTQATETKAATEAEIAQAQARIADLETALAEKTTLATEMLTELETEATSTFNQFNAKIAAQDTLINNLHRQIESLSAANAALTAQQTDKAFASIGSDPIKQHQLLNQLVNN
ncbi:MAG: hypothetical protein AAFY72_16270 [Cyanobacteria bacterium J06649_4]